MRLFSACWVLLAGSGTCLPFLHSPAWGCLPTCLPACWFSLFCLLDWILGLDSAFSHLDFRPVLAVLLDAVVSACCHCACLPPATAAVSGCLPAACLGAGLPAFSAVIPAGSAWILDADFWFCRTLPPAAVLHLPPALYSSACLPAWICRSGLYGLPAVLYTILEVSCCSACRFWSAWIPPGFWEFLRSAACLLNFCSIPAT